MGSSIKLHPQCLSLITIHKNINQTEISYSMLISLEPGYTYMDESTLSSLIEIGLYFLFGTNQLPKYQ